MPDADLTRLSDDAVHQLMTHCWGVSRARDLALRLLFGVAGVPLEAIVAEWVRRADQNDREDR